jgi:hypothetical protein
MSKLIFKKDGEDTVTVIHPVAREKIESELGRAFADDAEYMDFVQQRSQQKDSDGNDIKGSWRQCEDADIPTSREFRNAWIDSEPGSQIDIDCARAQAVVTDEMKAEHKRFIKNINEEIEVAVDMNDVAEENRLNAMKNQKAAALNSEMAKLNAMNNNGKVNDNAALQSIRDARDAYRNG